MSNVTVMPAASSRKPQLDGGERAALGEGQDVLERGVVEVDDVLARGPLGSPPVADPAQRRGDLHRLVERHTEPERPDAGVRHRFQFHAR
ncbi:hypothetical protein [Streptomyces sp. MC1]|uniref:hypothetical protein n=1 Tax=Streptomyces sp. MC1 TaxID=295105 RepID=UPI001E406EE7|nr:hypothetical protein [Streptomyces sp. MC1]